MIAWCAVLLFWLLPLVCVAVCWCDRWACCCDAGAWPLPGGAWPGRVERCARLKGDASIAGMRAIGAGQADWMRCAEWGGNGARLPSGCGAPVASACYTEACAKGVVGSRARSVARHRTLQVDRCRRQRLQGQGRAEPMGCDWVAPLAPFAPRCLPRSAQRGMLAPPKCPASQHCESRGPHREP